MDKTAVIILHYKNEQDTKDCLDSVFYPAKHHYIVVANQGKHDFVRLILKKYKGIQVIRTDHNVGFSQGNNLGLKKALTMGCTDFLLLNNDTIAGEGLIDKMVQFAHSDSLNGLISPKIYFYKGCEYYSDKYERKELGKVIWYGGGKLDWNNVYASHRGVDEVDNGQYDETVETDFSTGCCMLVTKKAMEKTGFLDPKYFLYYEDIDYSVRVKKQGLKIIYFPPAFLWHKNASSSDKPGSAIHLYYQTRNRLYFGNKYASFRTKKSLLFESFRQLFMGGACKKAVFDYYMGKMEQGDI
jgi:GT2 family glycosyltransferase